MAVKKRSVRKIIKKKVASKKKLVGKKRVSGTKKASKVSRKNVRKVPKKSAGKALPPKKKEIVVGKISHYFPKVRAAVIKLKVPLSVGDKIKIKGHTTDFAEEVLSMQVDHVPVKVAKKGQEIGLLVQARVRQGDTVVMA